MKKFQAIVGMLAVVLVSAQTFRHVYVRWIEPRESVLIRFEPTKQDIAASKSLDELVVLYEAALEKVKEKDAEPISKTEDLRHEYLRHQQEPYKSEEQLKQAILEWESHRQKLVELHFFWWAGLGSIVLGALAYWKSRQWLGVSAFVLGYLEMIWVTCPSFASFGYPVEFDRLLTFKVVYSVATLVLVLTAWFGVERNLQRAGEGKGGV